MKTKIGVYLLAIVLVSSLAVVGYAAEAKQSGVIKWQGQTCFPTTVAPYGPFGLGQTGVFACAKQWTDWLTKRTGGRLTIDWAEPATIFPLADSDKAVGQGVVQIAFSYGAYYAGRIPEGEIETGGVFLWDTEAELYECLFKYGLFEMFQKVYAKHKIFWLPLFNDGIAGIGGTFPMPTPDSLKGKKVRTLGLTADYISLLGGTPISMPWGDVYMAAKLGTIDAWVAGVAILEELKLKEVAKAVVVSPKIARGTTNILINMAAYEALPKDIQEILQKESLHSTYFTSTYWYNQCLWTVKNAESKFGVKPYYWSPDDTSRVTKLVAEKLFPKMGSKSPACAEMMEIIKKQMRDYGRL